PGDLMLEGVIRSMFFPDSSINPENPSTLAVNQYINDMVNKYAVLTNGNPKQIAANAVDGLIDRYAGLVPYNGSYRLMLHEPGRVAVAIAEQQGIRGYDKAMAYLGMGVQVKEHLQNELTDDARYNGLFEYLFGADLKYAKVGDMLRDGTMQMDFRAGLPGESSYYYISIEDKHGRMQRLTDDEGYKRFYPQAVWQDPESKERRENPVFETKKQISQIMDEGADRRYAFLEPVVQYMFAEGMQHVLNRGGEVRHLLRRAIGGKFSSSSGADWFWEMGQEAAGEGGMKSWTDEQRVIAEELYKKLKAAAGGPEETPATIMENQKAKPDG
ncbi:MAG: hypothetical protein O3A51_10675, partial [Verrucomicrobia bacterium]|nr:hypothetical protein [Verrucomicrobiota bacterium]